MSIAIKAFLIAMAIFHGSHDSGWASRYDPGVMQRVADYHGLDMSIYDGGIAVSDCSEIGNIWLLKAENSNEWLEVIVVDCAANDGTPEWMVNNNIIVELSYGLAERLGAVEGGVRVDVVKTDWRGE